MSKTTAKNFAVFCNACEYWLDYLGLKDYEVHYRHQECDCRAMCFADPAAGIAILVLSKEWHDCPVTDENVEKSAFHEVSELLLAKLVQHAVNRSTTREDIEISTHEIIRRMENTFYRDAIHSKDTPGKVVRGVPKTRSKSKARAVKTKSG